jgi:YwiC-like protein
MKADTGRSSVPAGARSRFRSVALPAEHGGWGLTLEPALLGLLVAPSVAGVLLAAAALVAFLARTPAKVVLVDRWRRRRLDRTTTAELVAAAELGALVGLLAGAWRGAGSGSFWVPLALAVPLLAVELWFDMRSRGRHLVPELAGAVGIGSVAAAIVLADGDGARLAAGLWLVVAARVVASVPFARFQLARGKRNPLPVGGSDAAQAAGLVLAAAAVALDGRLAVGLAAIAVLAAVQLVTARRPAQPAVVVGVEQSLLGVAVVLATALGVILP